MREITRRALGLGAAGAALAPLSAFGQTEERPTYDVDTPDYSHGALIDDRSFALDANLLRRAARAFRLPGPRATEPTDKNRRDYAVFALRGAIAPQMPDPPTDVNFLGPADRFQVTPKKPNYYDLGCLFGLWNLGDDKLTLFRGATLPNQFNVLKQAASDLIEETSALPTGLYSYEVGEHHAKVKDDPLYLPAVFCPTRSYKTLRPRGLTPLGAKAVWVTGTGHNIHPARTGDDNKGMKYSSQGCLVIEGNDKRKPDGTRDRTGAWEQFFRTLALDTNELSVRFYLFTAHEISYVYHRPTLGIAGLRYGSFGREVQMLQHQAGQPTTDGGIFGYDVQSYVMRSRQERPAAIQCHQRTRFHLTVWRDEFSQYDIATS